MTSTRRILNTLTLSVSALILPLDLFAADAASFEFGEGNKTKMARIGAQWHWTKRWWDSNGTHIGAYWDLSLSRWRGEQYMNVTDRLQHINSVGITPVFRLQSNDQRGLYAELGIGAHLLSRRYDNNGRQFSTKFQFGDHLGFGYVFRNGLEIGLKFQHFSNASIKKPNDGMNFRIIKLSYPL